MTRAELTELIRAQQAHPRHEAHNGTEPDLIEEEYRFTVRLWKEATAREC